jgi:hypothetical protein
MNLRVWVFGKDKEQRFKRSMTERRPPQSKLAITTAPQIPGLGRGAYQEVKMPD